MRAGESLVPMTKDMLKRIFTETEVYYSIFSRFVHFL